MLTSLLTLEAGQRLGAYEIVAPIGAGGMGEVYRARDTRLDRNVAIKILPAEFAANEALQERFEREAKTISALSHPNICSLFDVGQIDSHSYLVMEYLEGESLADRLAKGPLPIDQVLRMRIEIAGALECAHRQGIIHRDLKPGNIMLTRSSAKLLDFGLAKAQASGLGPRASVLETERKPLTEEGTIVGTFQYMAPEQVEGQPADARTDIFALGAVLYEAATGQRAFDGKSRASLIAAILDHEPPPISVVRPVAPQSLDRVVRACLRKDPQERIQTAHDLMLDLTWIRESSSAGEGLSPAARRRRPSFATALATLFALSTIAFALLYFRASSIRPASMTLSILAAPGTIASGDMALSPDGKSVVYMALAADGALHLFLRRFDDADPRPLAGSEAAQHAFWSPDGQWVAFFNSTHHKLKKVNVVTGAIQNICDIDYGVGGAWSGEGTIVFAQRFNDGLYRVPASGGDAVRATILNASRRESIHAWPSFLSDNHHFLFLIRTTAEERNQIAVTSLDGGPPKVLLKADSLVGFDRPYLLFVRENTLYAQYFDERSLETKGDAIDIGGGVAYSESWATSGASVSPAGVIAYYPVYTPRVEVRVYDRKGSPLRTLLTEDGVGHPRLSPDGRRLAFLKIDPKKGASDVWIIDLARGARLRITSGLANHQAPAWSPDGTRLAWSSDRDGMYDIYAKSVDDPSPPAAVWKSDRDKQSAYWMPDGRSVVTIEDIPGRNAIYVVGTNGEKPRLVLSDEVDKNGPVPSPDGRWIAYTARDRATAEVYAVAVSEGRKTQVSTSGGVFPRWSHDGSELYYVSPDHQLMAVPIRTAGTSFDPGVPKPLFVLPRAVGDPDYTTTPDGNFIVAAASETDTTPNHINILTGWRSKLPH